MFLVPLHLPLISAGYFGGVIGRMLEFLLLRVRRSDQGMTPSLSPGLRAQTVALHRRLMAMTGEFHRLARLAREGRLRVYPDRASPADRPETTSVEPGGVRSPTLRTAGHPRPEPDSPFGQPAGVVQGPTLPALPTRGFGWMLGFVPGGYRDALAGLLRNPEMVALIGASPAVARLLRSLCHSLGVVRPEGVFPAQHRRGPRAARHSRGGARMDLNGGTGPGRKSAPREPAVVMSAQARDRWWAEHRGGGCFAGDAIAAGDAIGAGNAKVAGERLDAPAQGRCAKR